MALNFGGNIFSGERERVIASFDFIDIAKNRAIQIFYGGHTFNTTTSEYSLTDNKFYSASCSTLGQISSATPTLITDIDFDCLIQVPIQIEGDVIVNVPIAVRKVGAGNTSYTYVIVSVIKVRDGVEEILGTKTSQTISQAVQGSETQTNTAVKINVTKTKIGAGDTIRITIGQYGYNDGAANTNIYLGHDPMGRTTNNNTNETTWTITSILQAQIPIVINL